MVSLDRVLELTKSTYHVAVCPCRWESFTIEGEVMGSGQADGPQLEQNTVSRSFVPPDKDGGPCSVKFCSGAPSHANARG